MYFKVNYATDVIKAMELKGLDGLYVKNFETDSEVWYLEKGGIKDYFFPPTSQVDSLLGKNINVNVKIGSRKNHPLILRGAEIIDIGNLGLSENEIAYNNTMLQKLSNEYGMPLFDLNALFSKINKGTFTTDDGVFVESKWPNGNFFSADGIYPTAFGQAVIANEVIKVINANFKTNIPLISTRDFLN